MMLPAGWLLLADDPLILELMANTKKRLFTADASHFASQQPLKVACHIEGRTASKVFGLKQFYSIPLIVILYEI